MKAGQNDGTRPILTTRNDQLEAIVDDVMGRVTV